MREQPMIEAERKEKTKINNKRNTTKATTPNEQKKSQ